MPKAVLNRRHFLGAAGGLFAAARFPHAVAADGLPEVKNPRTTSGDDRHEPQWEDRLTITVGPQKADISGNTDRPIQAAVDYVTRLGGGTVQLLPGTYTLRAAIWLNSKVRLLGSGADSIITKHPSIAAKLSDDSDWYDQEITLVDAKGFEVGDSVCLQVKDPHNGGDDVLKRVLVARSGNRFKLDKALRENFWLSGAPTISNLFPLLTSEYTSDVTIENLTLDGNGKNNVNFNGNYGGCIFLQDCNRYNIRNVEARNYNGDGISWQISHDVVVENCHSHDNADLGLHPGSGSQRPRMRSNKLERNGIGIFFCWGIKYGLAEKNVIQGNRDYGVSIGHNDTDNIIRDNDIQYSGKVGVLFRDENRGKDFWPNRNLVEKNRIINSGPEEGVAVDVHGKVHDVTIAHNEIRETRGAMKRTAIRIAKEAKNIHVEQNKIEGFAVEIADSRNV
ncbi:MAG: right-handed parallel beta-helix repeat-containing protein [Planctomycetaceae bacterium]